MFSVLIVETETLRVLLLFIILIWLFGYTEYVTCCNLQYVTTLRELLEQLGAETTTEGISRYNCFFPLWFCIFIRRYFIHGINLTKPQIFLDFVLSGLAAKPLTSKVDRPLPSGLEYIREMIFWQLSKGWFYQLWRMDRWTHQSRMHLLEEQEEETESVKRKLTRESRGGILALQSANFIRSECLS